MSYLDELISTFESRNDKGEWRQGHFDRDRIFVRDPAGLAGPMLGERVVLRANKMFPHDENVAAIVSLVNTAPELLEIASALRESATARAWNKGGDSPTADAAMIRALAALARLEAK